MPSPEREEAIRLRQINEKIYRRRLLEEYLEKGFSYNSFRISCRYANNGRREELREERRINREYPLDSMSPHA